MTTQHSAGCLKTGFGHHRPNHHEMKVGPPKHKGTSLSTLILVAAVTGAKFTPRNHRATRHPVLDAATSGVLIKHRAEDVLDEARRLSDIGCRYWHFHARNPMTNEQTTSNSIYQATSRGVQAYGPSMIMSFGASRNGAEVKHSIQQFGEWERIGVAPLTNAVAVSERMKFDALDAHHEIEMTRLSLTLEQRSESVGAAA